MNIFIVNEMYTVQTYIYLFALYINCHLAQDFVFPTENLKETISYNETFSFVLKTNQILKKYFRPNENVLFSPLSISVVLAILALGTKDSLKEEIFRVLNQDMKSLQNSELLREANVYLANAIFLQDDVVLSKQFKIDAEKSYKCEVIKIGYSNKDSVHIINNWISNKTNGTIVNILSSPPAKNIKIILSNAVYFFGEWETKFFKGATKKQPFYINGKDKPYEMVDMMVSGGVFPYYVDDKLNCQVLGLPYKGNTTTMFIIMPRSNTTIDTLESQLTTADLMSYVKNVQYVGLIISFPKIDLTKSVDLKQMFQQLGLASLFAPNKNDLYIDEALHKTRIKVTESGTVAASTTLVTLTRDGNRISFNANSPFLFFVYHRPTRNTLFWGCIKDPIDL